MLTYACLIRRSVEGLPDLDGGEAVVETRGTRAGDAQSAAVAFAGVAAGANPRAVDTSVARVEIAIA